MLPGIRPGAVVKWCQGSAWLGCLMVPGTRPARLFFLSDAKV